MKKNNSLFQIGEVAYLLGISRKMILDYEAAGLISPSCIDKFSGYRYFDAEIIAKLQLVLDLRRADMSIKQINHYLNGDLTVDEQINQLKEKIQQIEVALKQLSIRNLEESTVSEVHEIVLPAQYCICNNFVAADIETAIEAFSNTFFECLKQKHRLDKSGNSFCEFSKDILSEDLYDTANLCMRACIAVDNASESQNVVFFPKTNAVAASYCGSYEDVIAAYEKLKAFILKHSITPIGYPREFYIEGNFDNNHNNNIVWVVVPVK